MDTQRWNRLKEVYDRALDLPAPDRVAFVERHCGRDREMLTELKSLLSEEDSVVDILNGASLDAAVPHQAGGKGRRIGAYRVIRQLGSGGMGEVYLAERADGQFERRVALKLVRTGIQSDRILARFRSERSILGRLEHPNIARMSDAGVSDDGLPYFVLEYVDGTPIDRYANENGLGVEARLELFDQVCRAVTYAHASLVVHRDLKPSNILVTSNGRVKLLDFGIAKVLSDGQNADEPLTQTGAALMTPAYASPEQARGEHVKTASDIYSLGVILYELLTGLRPYEVDQHSPLETARIICDFEPDRPSTRIDDQSATTQVTHGTDPERLRRVLSGDLDVICLKALRKEPERRYITSDELREDLRRYLRDEPIAARAESKRYRMGKFVRRHRMGVGAAATVILLIAGLVGYYTVRLSTERDRARLEAEKARQVAEFVQQAFAVPNPDEHPGETLTAREVLDQGAARLEDELADQPEVLAEMLAVIGETYRGLGLYESALALHEKELSLNTRLYGPASEAVATTLNNLGRGYHRVGEYQKSDSLHRRALAIRHSIHGNTHTDVATSMNNAGLMTEQLGRYAEAESLLTEALDIRLTLLGPDHPTLAVLYNNLGRIEDRLGHYRDALSRYDESLRLLAIDVEPPHPHIAIALKNRADTQRKLGRYAEAESTYREVLSMTGDLYEADHPRVATVLVAFSRVLIELGSFDEAQGVLSEANRILNTQFGPGHPGLTSVWIVQSRLDAALGNYRSADSLRRQALSVNRDRFGDDNHRVANDLARLSELQLLMGDPETAAATQREALEIRRATYGEDHPYVASDLHGLAECLAKLGQTEAARRLAAQALAMRIRFLGDEHPYVTKTRALLQSL